jgi:hypothetical protein
VQIGPVLRVIDMGLVDRAQMIYRMLLGRTALGQDFLVDPSGRYLLTAPPELVARRRVSNLPVRRGAK